MSGGKRGPPRRPVDPPEPYEFDKAIPRSLSIFDEAYFEEVVAHLPTIADRLALHRDLIRLCSWLSDSLYERKRVQPRAVRAKLEELSGTLERAQSALASLGEDATRHLSSRAGRRMRLTRDKATDAFWAHNGGSAGQDSALPDKVGAERISVLKLVLEDASLWAAEAAQNVNVPGIVVEPVDPDDPASKPIRRGDTRPSNAEADEAMRSLIGIWEEQTGANPTISTLVTGLESKKHGPFLDFCTAVLKPVYEAHGVKRPSIQALAAKHLYPPRGE